MSESNCDLSLKEFSGAQQFSLAVKGDITWNTFCQAMRNGVRSYIQSDGNETSNSMDSISINDHSRILEMIRFGLIHDNPPHIIFPGLKDSFIQMSAEFTCPRAFTVCMWLKIDEDTAMKGFLLCRCRCPTGGLDVILSERQTDGKWLVTMEGSADGPNFSSAASNFEVKGSVYISHGKWHLLSIRHQSSYTRSPKISFIVDGNLEFENELPYPFLNATVESQWLFGLRFKGLLTSASLYPEEVSLPLLTLLYNKGPHMHSLTHGVVGTPQASFDTGHVILGTQIAKGPSAAEACRTVPAFGITAHHFVPLSNLPQCPPGRQNVDHIEMTPRLVDDSSAEGNLLLPSITGGCQLSMKDGVNTSRGWAESWLTAGGCPLLLYLLQEYVRGVPQSLTTKPTAQDAPVDFMMHVRQTICLLATLIESSAELKEQFIQIHGFHVVSSCMSQLRSREVTITKDIVDCCVELTLSLGLDALKGDGIAAALQGLLLDFRIWGDCNDGVKLYLLNSISNVMASTGDQLYINIGLQRLLDIFRLHICPSNIDDFLSDLPAAPVTVTLDQANLKLECANACARLLVIAIDAGLTITQKSISIAPFYNEAEMLCACLEETSNSLMAERILRVMTSLRTTAPAALLHAMVETRFAETTAIGLLTHPNFSTEVRRETVTNILWALGEQLKHIPHQLALTRKGGNGHRLQNRNFSSHIPGTRRAQSDASPPLSTALEKGSGSGSYPRETQGQSLQRTLVRPLERAWLITSMLAEVIGKAIKEGNWNDGVGSSASTVSEVLVAFSHDGPLGTVHAWLVLPMLPVLFTYGNFRCNLRALMSLNVLIKTDDTQYVALTSLPDRAWVRLLVSIALIGEKGRQQSLLQAIEHSASKNKESSTAHTDITSDYSVVDVKELCADADAVAVAVKDEVNWALEAEIAATITELSLDAASTVLEGKMRHNGSESWSTWNCLQNCLKSGCKAFQDDSEGLEVSFLKRCVSVVVQRLARSSEGWTTDTLKGVNNILTFVENRHLCGNVPLVTPGSKKNAPLKTGKLSPLTSQENPKVSFIDIDSPTVRKLPQNEDELQIMSFLTDLLSSLRKSVERNGAVGEEALALRTGFHVILGCLSNTSEVGADKISKEIFDQLCFMTEPYSGCSAEAFKEFIMLIFTNLQETVNDETVSEELTGRYCALVYLIMHHFLDIRHKIACGETVSPHVLPALDALAGVDTAKDVKLIFRLLEVSMHTADAISFADVSTDDLDQTNDDAKSGDTALSNMCTEDFVDSPLGTPGHWDQSTPRDPNPGAPHEEGDSLHGLDILMVEMDEFNAAVFDESDCEPDTPDALPSNERPDSVSCKAVALLNDEASELPQEGLARDSPDGLIDGPLVDPTHTPHPVIADNKPHEGDMTVQTKGSDATRPVHSAVLFSPIVVSVFPPNEGENPRDATSGTPRNKAFYDWVKTRRGISLVRMDSERARLARTSEALQLAAEATDKFWVKLSRKIESESFNDAHDCQWKLGVSHESFFPGRRRVVLRPRFDVCVEEPPLDDDDVYRERVENEGEDEKEVDEFNPLEPAFGDFGEVKAALAKALGSLINDITQSGPTDSLYIATSPTTEENSKRAEPDSDQSSSEHGPRDAAKIRAPTAVPPGTVVAPGCGWGLVDADGSDEGYDVVGLEMGGDTPFPAQPESDVSPVGEKESHEGVKKAVVAPHSATKPLPTAATTNDRMGDVRLVEASLKEGRDAVETGPCHSGTKKAGSGPTILRSRVIMVTASGNFWGSLSFNGKEVFFTSSFEPEDGHKDDNAAVNLVQQLRMRRRRWTLSSVCAIYLRRYRLRDTAMEIFFRRGKHRNFFVDFGHTREDERHRQAFARALMDVAPGGCFKQWPSMSPFRLVPELGVQEKWVSGRMSNFDYLMALNTISGRSFNDLCQYPVMPWIISQYENDTIDLADPASFRDLSKPVGALNETRLKDFLERFHSFGEQLSSGGSSVGNSVGSGCRDSIPAFMYGSHYSTMMGVVLHFLVRLQPFASLHKEMQSGRFDVPDRLFSSIPRSYKHNTTQLSEVKELTPEWFTTPEMFRNVNNFNFGQTQDGDAVGDVILPPWAANAEEFVRINREAMESDYVSDHLQEWIDLIFGYKQRGPAAVEANNVFYYLTYSGSVNRDVVINESLRRATELQIAHFGQIPMQLFRTPHPCKRTCGSMGNGSIAGAMTAAPRALRKSFAAPAPHTVVSHTSAHTTPPSAPGSASVPSSSEVAMPRTVPLRSADASSTEEAPAPLPMPTPVPAPAAQRIHVEKQAIYALAYPENDEEAVAVESPCTLVLRPFAQPVIVTPTRPLRTVPVPWGKGRKVAFESLGPSYVPPSTILSLCVLPDRLLVVLGTGVVEAYRYYTSEAAKSVLAITAAQPPQSRRTYTTQRRRNAAEVARKHKALKAAKAEAQALLDSSALERELANKPVISFMDDVIAHTDSTHKPSEVDSLRLEALRQNPLSVDLPSDPSTSGGESGIGMEIGASSLSELKNKNSNLRGTLQTSSSVTIAQSKVESTDRSHSDPKEPAAEADKTALRGSTPAPVSASAPAAIAQRRILSRKEPLVCVERDSSHFDVLPRLPLTKLLLCRNGPAPAPAPVLGSSASDPTLSNTAGSITNNNSNNGSNNGSNNSSSSNLKVLSTPNKNPTQSTPLYALEQAAGLIVFSRSGRLALSGGRVDGSIAVREVDPRTGFILSAADFHAHHHRVICIAADSIAFARTDVIVSCDALGQTFVWTVSRLKTQAQPSGFSSYVISRRPQRLFRCQPSQHMRCEISWQLGLVVTVSVGVVHIFSVERDERLRAFEYDWEEEVIEEEVEQKVETAEKAVVVEVAGGTHSECTSESGHVPDDGPFVAEVNKKDFHSSDKSNISGLSSTYKKRTVHKTHSNGTNGTTAEEECSIARRIALCDDGTVILHVEVPCEPDSSGPLEPPVSEGGKRESEKDKGATHYVLSYSLSGVRTGRIRMSCPVTFLSAPDKSSDILICGQEDGAVTIFRASDLSVLYSFYPHLESAPQPQITTSFPNPFSGPQSPPPSSGPSSKSPSPTPPGSTSSTSNGFLNNAILCVRAGPSPESPSVLCISAASGALYVRPLPDFVRWERTRIPSALSQLVNAPIQAVRGTILHAQTYAAEAAGVMAENAKMFVAEKMEKMNKSKVLKFFGFGNK